MTGITLSLKGLPQLRARLNAIDNLGPLMRDLALTAVSEQKKLSPVKTGNLRRTIHVGSVTPRSADTIASAAYAAHVEFGTRPHEIRPRYRKVLSWKGAGGPVFARRVRHPGTKAQPYMLPGAEEAVRSVALRDRIVDNWNRAA